MSAWQPEILNIPIRDELVVRIAGIPHDLTQAEAGRVSAVIMAMAAPPSPAPPSSEREGSRAGDLDAEGKAP